ncbi:TrbI/VirB10 family protein [Novosphingobium flavum]|uniref:TrbI/VirB10 family protein n=1 Tax=Novosphingobium flavum TaxID=1778672 RepID=A0A7X1KK31_9SPHN|nr:TrbI/VirB10 family protein [Novosphingobium flavum]MBC2664092.1 TrbI/VirB10 family protein [Novosphingobium flavum]
MARQSNRQSNRLLPPGEGDPREGQGAEIIDLATRTALPQVSQRRGGSDGLVMLGGVAFVALIGALTFWSLNGRREAPAAAASQVRADVPPPVPAQAITTIQPRRAVALPQQPGAAVSAAGQAAPAGNPLGSPTVVFDASSYAAPIAPGMAAPAAFPVAIPSGAGNDDFAARLGVSGNGAAVATAGINPKTTVSQGTLIPAVLETAIDTDVPGYVRAVVSADVRSFDGSRVLVPRSSRLIGQYKSGLQAGQKRAYVIWTRLIRPDGASVALGSPAVGFGGETGIAGKVDTHFFERFGSAMLLSVVGGLQAVASGGATLVLGGGQSAAATAVGQSGNIGPTVRVRQGEPIRVFTARDLDFSKVSPE